jgi:hypothetical protein
VSRATVIDLAADLGVPCREADIDLYDAYNAHELFPAVDQSLHLPRTQRQWQPDRRWQRVGPDHQTPDIEPVACDFVAQYLKHLS